MSQVLREEQVLRILDEAIDSNIETAVKYAEINTDIGCGRTLPLEIIVGDLLRSKDGSL